MEAFGAELFDLFLELKNQFEQWANGLRQCAQADIAASHQLLQVIMVDRLHVLNTQMSCYYKEKLFNSFEKMDNILKTRQSKRKYKYLFLTFEMAVKLYKQILLLIGTKYFSFRFLKEEDVQTFNFLEKLKLTAIHKLDILRDISDIICEALSKPEMTFNEEMWSPFFDNYHYYTFMPVVYW